MQCHDEDEARLLLPLAQGLEIETPEEVSQHQLQQDYGIALAQAAARTRHEGYVGGGFDLGLGIAGPALRPEDQRLGKELLAAAHIHRRDDHIAALGYEEVI